MTTERNLSEKSPAGAMLEHGSVLLSIAFCWFLAMALIMRFAEVTPAALVIAPQDGFLEDTPGEIKLLRSGRNAFVVTSTQDGYVRTLYAAGAWLVLPSLRNGCLDLR